MRIVLLPLPLGLVCHTACATAPLPPPSDLEVWSVNRKYVAVLKYNENRTSVFSVQPGGKRERLWGMTGWFRWTRLSDDGEYLAIPYWSANLLAHDHRKDEAMLTLVKRGRTVAVVKLEDLISDFSKFSRPPPHHWGRYVGFNKKNQFVIETVEGKRFFVSPTEGNLRQETNAAPKPTGDLLIGDSSVPPVVCKLAIVADLDKLPFGFSANFGTDTTELFVGRKTIPLEITSYGIMVSPRELRHPKDVHDAGAEYRFAVNGFLTLAKHQPLSLAMPKQIAEEKHTYCFVIVRESDWRSVNYIISLKLVDKGS